MTTTTRLQRAQGCLLGQCVGDALGAQVEFFTAEEVRQKYPDGVREMAGREDWNTVAGQITDDSEMALALARTVASGQLDAASILGAYRDWFASGPFDWGATIEAALRLGMPNPDSQANGSLMRVSPLAIWGAGKFVAGQQVWDGDAAAAYIAIIDSGLTHPAEVCGYACAVYVSAIARVVATTGVLGRGGLRQLQQGLSHPALLAFEGARVQLARLRLKAQDTAAIDVALLDAVESALDEAKTAPPPEADGEKRGWWRVAFQNAFYQAEHASSFEEGMISTMALGGDTDTNGAIAGALLGAIHGVEGIPARWRSAVLESELTARAADACVRPAAYCPTDALQLAERLLKSFP